MPVVPCHLRNQTVTKSESYGMVIPLSDCASIYAFLGHYVADCHRKPTSLAPFIHYSAIGHLLKKSRQESPEGVYLPLSVYHRWVNTETGEPLSHYRVSAEAPYEQLLEGFRRERARWEGSGACNQLRQTLASAGVQQVDKIIGFACSTMYRYGQFSYICAMQHALLLSLRDFFTPSATNAQAPRCIVQDPSYQAADREILEGEGMSIVDDPWGFLEVDETSVVFSCGPDVPVQDIVANIARPAVMIWDDRFGASYKPFEEQLQEEITWQVTPGCRYGAYRSLLTWAADLLRADPISPRSEKMIRDHYTRFDFPKFPEDAAYGFADGVAIYVRRREGENADE